MFPSLPADQTKAAMLQAGIFSVSLRFYKIVMLAWALWLANALIASLRWGFDPWAHGGYWRKPEPKPAAQTKPAPIESTLGDA